MAKRKKAEPNGTAGTIDATEEGGTLAELSPTDRKKLFVAYDRKNKEVEKARKELEKLLGERSNIVEQIAISCGTGPFAYEGQILTVISRARKETGEKTWYFKSPGKNEVIEV